MLKTSSKNTNFIFLCRWVVHWRVFTVTHFNNSLTNICFFMGFWNSNMDSQHDKTQLCSPYLGPMEVVPHAGFQISGETSTFLLNLHQSRRDYWNQINSKQFCVGIGPNSNFAAAILASELEHHDSYQKDTSRVYIFSGGQKVLFC